VRDTQGTGSGWAGLSSYDWNKLDAPALAQRALQKCVASRNPVALEPGRYTVILEPQAVADLVEVLVASFLRPPIPGAEGGQGPWPLAHDARLQAWRTKLGLRVVDERLTLSHDPMDPLLGILPEPGTAPVTWIEHGVLTNLYYDRAYALAALHANLPVRPPEFSYRLSGGTTSVDEMIASTTRGLLVTRFSGVSKLDHRSLLSTGLTRDGLWLIENGKITKSVKNFRFTESPLFVLNQVEQLGPPASVFRPVRRPDQPSSETEQSYYLGLTPVVVPPLKARDFSFTAMADAV
jgi:predicted Zn-dependent protease